MEYDSYEGAYATYDCDSSWPTRSLSRWVTSPWPRKICSTIPWISSSNSTTPDTTTSDDHTPYPCVPSPPTTEIQIKTEDIKEEVPSSPTFIMEPLLPLVNTSSPISCPSPLNEIDVLTKSLMSQAMAPPTEVPLRATQACKEMRQMMGAFRLNPFCVNTSCGEKEKGDKVLTWCGEEPHALDEEPKILEWQLIGYNPGFDDKMQFDMSSLRAFSPDFEVEEDGDGNEEDSKPRFKRRRVSERDDSEDSEAEDVRLISPPVELVPERTVVHPDSESQSSLGKRSRDVYEQSTDWMLRLPSVEYGSISSPQPITVSNLNESLRLATNPEYPPWLAEPYTYGYAPAGHAAASYQIPIPRCMPPTRPPAPLRTFPTPSSFLKSDNYIVY